MTILFLTLLVLTIIAAPLNAQSGITVKTYPSDQSGRITMGPDGALWFTESVIGKIARLTKSGVMTEFTLPNPDGYAFGGYPFGIALGSDGALWFTEVYAHKIGRITTDGSITEYAVGGNPSAAFLTDIVAGPDGALWFNRWCSGISRITTTGVITDYLTHSCPTWMTVGPDGGLWYADAIHRVGRLAMDGSITEYSLPGYYLHSITVGPDKALWFIGDVPTPTVGHSPTIGRITTTGVVTKYIQPTDREFPYLIAPGPDGALWFTNAYNNYNIGRITTTGVSSIVSLGNGPCRYPYNPFNDILQVGRDLWLSCSSGGIVQISFPDRTPPNISTRLTPTVLWPPNGNMVPVNIAGTITDDISGVLAGSTEYAVLDEYRFVQPAGHFVVDGAGNYRITVLLRASREGNDLDGRKYLIRIRARDNAGNRAVKWASVVVPHDRR
jgi:virginiamycin B lyase